MSVDSAKQDMFAANFRRSGRRGTIHWEWAPLEGEAGGFSNSTTSNTDITVFVTASSKVFHLKTLIITNSRANVATVNLFASDGGGKQRANLIVPATDSLVLGAGTPGMDLNGQLYGFSYSTGALYARVLSASTEVSIFAGGQIRDQDNT